MHGYAAWNATRVWAPSSCGTGTIIRELRMVGCAILAFVTCWRQCRLLTSSLVSLQSTITRALIGFSGPRDWRCNCSMASTAAVTHPEALIIAGPFSSNVSMASTCIFNAATAARKSAVSVTAGFDRGLRFDCGVRAFDDAIDKPPAAERRESRGIVGPRRDLELRFFETRRSLR